MSFYHIMAYRESGNPVFKLRKNRFHNKKEIPKIGISYFYESGSYEWISISPDTVVLLVISMVLGSLFLIVTSPDTDLKDTLPG